MTATISETKRIKGYTYAEALEKLDQWKTTLDQLATSQSYGAGSHNLTRVKPQFAKDMIDYFSGIVAQFESGARSGIRMQIGLYRD